MMKKFLFIFSLMLISTASFAQQGTTTWGAHFDYFLDTPNNPGIGVSIGHEFVDNVRGVAEFDYLFKNKGASGWNINVNAEYLFSIQNILTVYPIAGMNVLGWSGDESTSKLGLNLGGGIEYPVSNNIILKAEFMYKTQWNGYSTINVGFILPL